MLRVLIIDNDAAAADALEGMLIKRNISVDAKAADGNEGLHAITQHPADIVFLDIELPRMNGFDMLQALPSINFHIILVTADEKYALKAIRFSALDYLLKPVTEEALDIALFKARNRIELQQRLLYKSFLDNNKSPDNKLKTLALPTDHGFVFVSFDNIVWCEAEGSYTKVHLQNKSSVMVCKGLKLFEPLLDEKIFMRIHYSHIINLNHIIEYIRGEGGQVVMADNVSLNVARSCKEEFLKRIAKV